MHRWGYGASLRSVRVRHGGTVTAPSTRAILRPAALLLALSLALLALWSTPAAAHTQLLGSDPADGETLAEGPDWITLRFNEPVEAEFDPVEVLDPRGERVDGGEARVSPDDARVVEAGLEGLPEGSYTARWRVTSIDGHVVEGEFGFSVAAGGASAGGEGEEPEGGAASAAPPSDGQSASGEGPGNGGAPVLAYAAASLGVAAVAVLAVVGLGALRRRGSRSETGP